MRIVQVVEGYRKDEGVGNVVAAIDQFLKQNHYETRICNRRLGYEDIESELFGSGTVVFYHLAVLVDPVIKYLKCRKVLVFHNITEPEFLTGADEEKRILNSAGLYDAARTAGYFDMAVTFSEYSRKCLIDMGWRNEDIIVLPILVRLKNFQMEPSREIVEKYKSGSVNILFTGRIYPNKKQEDVIAAFAAYKEQYNKNARLFLVGSIPKGNYYPSLLAYAKKVGVLGDVIFTGHVTFEEYLAYYHIADIYLCMSAHEGFCIPLVEAMYFRIPIIAHASTAVPDTLNGSGVLLHCRKPEMIAGIMDRIVKDTAYRQSVIDGQDVRKRQLMPEVVENQYLAALDEIVNKLSYYSAEPITKVDDRYQFSLINDLSEQIEQLVGKHEKYVVYGSGAAGTRLYAQLKKNYKGDRLVLCDAFKTGAYEPDLGCMVISPKEAVERYGNDIFIVSVQDKRTVLEVVLFLLEQGIGKEQILIYDKLADQII